MHPIHLYRTELVVIECSITPAYVETNQCTSARTEFARECDVAYFRYVPVRQLGGFL